MKFPISTHLNLKKIMISLAKQKNIYQKILEDFPRILFQPMIFFQKHKKIKKDKYYLIG